MKYKLKVPCMCKIFLGIVSSDNIPEFKHIVQNAIPSCSCIVAVVAVKIVLDFGKGLLDWVQVRRIWW
jgi:hypothetical protein